MGIDPLDYVDPTNHVNHKDPLDHVDFTYPIDHTEPVHHVDPTSPVDLVDQGYPTYNHKGATVYLRHAGRNTKI